MIIIVVAILALLQLSKKCRTKQTNMILTTVSFDRDSLLVDLKNRINVLEAMDTVFSTVKKMQKMAAEQSRAEKTNFKRRSL